MARILTATEIGAGRAGVRLRDDRRQLAALAPGKREQVVVQFNVPADTAKDPVPPPK